jgi:hypothetical protein
MVSSKIHTATAMTHGSPSCDRSSILRQLSQPSLTPGYTSQLRARSIRQEAHTQSRRQDGLKTSVRLVAHNLSFSAFSQVCAGY